jgi:hypothetical protein
LADAPIPARLALATGPATLFGRIRREHREVIERAALLPRLQLPERRRREHYDQHQRDPQHRNLALVVNLW